MESAVTAPVKRERALRLRRYLTGSAIAFGCAYLADGWFHSRYMICHNLTESLPQHVFIVKKGDLPRPGDYIGFAVGGNARQYPPGTVFIKIAVAGEGSCVEHRGGHVFVDGVDRGAILDADHKGLPLRPGRTGVIPDGSYYVWTPHPQSYDSRYWDIGFPGLNSGVIGRAYALF